MSRSLLLQKNINQQGIVGPAGPQGIQGDAGIIPIYDSVGLVVNPKMWVGQVTSGALGQWTIDTSSAGFTTILNITAMSESAAGPEGWNSVWATVFSHTIIEVTGATLTGAENGDFATVAYAPNKLVYVSVLGT